MGNGEHDTLPKHPQEHSWPLLQFTYGAYSSYKSLI